MAFVRRIKYKLRVVFIKNKIYLFKTIALFKRYKVEDSIIISSETRGGSTWLMELLYSIPDTIINWEPLHVKKGVVPKNYNWGERPYIPENAIDPQAEKLMNQLLRFKIYSSNSVRFCTLSDFFKTNRVMTKMVRSNLLLPWLTKTFDFKHKPIYLLRHPIAVSKSQLRNIPEDQGVFSEFQIPDIIHNERYAENREYINSLKTRLERQVALWCLHNMEIINHIDSGKRWVVVYYEELLLNTEKEIARISDEINLRIPIDSNKFDKPSKSDFFHEFQKDKKKQLSKWKDNLSEDELANLQKIFDHFGLTIYNAKEIIPVQPTGT